MAISILIVDDSATMRGFIKRTLQATELPLGDVWEASNGREGLEQMRANWMDLVLADLNMPDMTGVEMIEQMAQDPMLSVLPVVVVSSEGDQSVLHSLAQKGVREFIRKPFQAQTLKDVIEKTLATAE
ncbi:MAG TPA: response regulator [bacterium]|nr:response regulator [bacterium]